MYVVEHALLNLVRNKSRNILFGVIIFAIITAAVVAVSIFNTAGIVIEETRETMDNAKGVESLQNLTLAFLIIVLVLGAVIMMLLSAIVIRERKYEIGVLRAMGMEKNKVALGLWIEIFAITCICYMFGMGAGAVISQPVSDMILSGQNNSISAGSTSLADRLNITVETEESIQMKVSVNAITAIQILGISILLASIAGVISITQITKSEPLYILMEGN